MKKAFTLAEILLTLAIIGVAAALTLPALITKVARDQYVVVLKKAYNTLKAVELEAVQEHGPLKNWNWTGNAATEFETYFKPYFDILKDCGADTDNGCFADSYPYMNGDTSANLNRDKYYRIITSDGISIAYYSRGTNVSPESKGFFNVDVNGRKGPNVIGKDLYIFLIFPTAGIKPGGSMKVVGGNLVPIPQEEVLEDCREGGRGDYCAARVLSENAINLKL